MVEKRAMPPKISRKEVQRRIWDMPPDFTRASCAWMGGTWKKRACHISGSKRDHEAGPDGRVENAQLKTHSVRQRKNERQVRKKATEMRRGRGVPSRRREARRPPGQGIRGWRA
eukprot:2648329-Rhodomonas_salina.1